MTRRLILIIPTLIGLSILTFILARVVPGDPASLAAGPRADAEMVQVIVEEFGLDRSLPVQYINYMGDMLTGDWGRSMVTNRHVLPDLLHFFPATVELVLFSMVLAFVVGIPLGISSAVYQNRWLDHASRMFALSSVSFPIFWLALMLQLLLGGTLGLLPITGRFEITATPPESITGLYLVDSLLHGDLGDFGISLKHIILPGFVQSIGAMATITRILRSDVIEVMQSDYVTMERANAIPEKVILGKYVLKNAFISTLTMTGLFMGFAIGGSVLVEAVFSWPGVGLYAVNSLLTSDFQPIMGFTILTGAAFILINLIVDVLYGFFDPRIRYS